MDDGGDLKVEAEGVGGMGDEGSKPCGISFEPSGRVKACISIPIKAPIT